VVKSDPAVSTEILRVANTIHFNRSSRRVTSIKDAIVRLGFTQTKNMAASMSVVQSMKDKNYQTGFSHQAFWLHCLGVAIVAEKLAKQSKLVSPEEAFVCGLLHDLGVMILNEFFNELFLTILEYTTDNGCRFIEAEKAILGFTHHDFLKVLLEKWNFDPTTIEGMVTYPDLTSFTVPFIKENPLSAIVNIADNLTNAFCIGQSADACIEPIPQEFMRILALPHGITSHFLDSIFHSFNIFNDFLQISKERFPDAIQPLRQLSDSKLLFYAFDRDSFFHPIEHYFRLRHSQAIFCQEEQELLDRLESAHIMCIAGAGAEHSQALAKAMSGQMLPMPSLDSSAPLSNRAKALIMNTGNAKIALTQGLNIITRYPIDVRNVQLAMAMLLNDLPVSPELSSKGFLKKQKDFDSKGNIIGNIHAMVLYNTNEFKDTLQQVLTSVHFPSPDFVNEPSKAINHAKTAQNELHCIIIEAPVTDPDTSNTVAAIKALPTHKRARFIIVDKGLEKKEIEKLKLLKIQEIIHLDALQSTLETFVNEQAS
jgi:HD-like signal output (HDOD) protein